MWKCSRKWERAWCEDPIVTTACLTVSYEDVVCCEDSLCCEDWLCCEDRVCFYTGGLCDVYVPIHHHGGSVLPCHHTARCSERSEILPQSRLLSSHQRPGRLSTLYQILFSNLLRCPRWLCRFIWWVFAHCCYMSRHYCVLEYFSTFSVKRNPL